MNNEYQLYGLLINTQHRKHKSTWMATSNLNNKNQMEAGVLVGMVWVPRDGWGAGDGDARSLLIKTVAVEGQCDTI